jgi:hypothetical protein
MSALARSGHSKTLVAFDPKRTWVPLQKSRNSGRGGDQDNPLSPMHGRMRAIDRDLIREGHYGQRPCVPHSKAEHMAAPTNAANVMKALANSAPSTLCGRRFRPAACAGDGSGASRGGGDRRQ